jgi:ABC-type amino acid transport system permease subunit
MIPALVSQVITLLKDTSLLYIIAVLELARKGRILQSGEGNPLQTYFVVGMIFLVPNLILSRLSRRLEVRQRQRYGAGAIKVAGVEDLTVLEVTADARLGKA